MQVSLLNESGGIISHLLRSLNALVCAKGVFQFISEIKVHFSTCKVPKTAAHLHIPGTLTLGVRHYPPALALALERPASAIQPRAWGSTAPLPHSHRGDTCPCITSFTEANA